MHKSPNVSLAKFNSKTMATKKTNKTTSKSTSKTRTEFELKNRCTLIPIYGKTQVQVETTGKVKIMDFTPSEEPRVRKIDVCSTKHARMWLSPGGVNRTVQICLPAKAEQEAFEKEMDMLFEVLDMKEGEV